MCVFSILEPCRTFSFCFQRGGPFVRSARRKCLHLYFYFMDRDFGLLHVRIQTWFPMQIQVYLNAHEWLARKLSVHQVRYTKHDNVFLLMEDMAKAQRFADRFASLHWPTILEKYAKRVNPQMRDIFHDRSYYWVTAQNEYSTDILYKTRPDPCELYYPQLLSHSTLCFGAREAMNFLGRNLHGKFESEIVSDLSSLVCRRTGGSRIKHRVKENWLKMYDKSGLVLRVATIINNPEEFRVRKQVSREGKRQTEWVEMRKGVAYLFRYREVSLEANGRYLDALAVVDDPAQAKRDLDRVTTPKKDAAGRGCSGFNPLARHDAKTRSAAEGQGDKMIRVVTLDPFEEKEIQKFCQLLDQVKAVRSFRYDKAVYLTKRKLKDRNLQTGAASACGYSIYGKTLALVSTHPKKDIDEGFRYVSRVAVYHVGHLWELHRCLDPRCSMYRPWTPSYLNGEPALCTFCRAESEHKIRMAKS